MTMNKKYTIGLLISLFFITSSFANTSQKGTNKKTDNSEKRYAITIDKPYFIKNISDIDKNPNEWKYLGDKPCIIDFYTTWCGPCRMLAPVLEDLAKQYEGKIYIYKANAEKEKEIAQAFKVQAYPTLIFCPMSGNPQMAKGALPKAQLVEAIEQILLKKKAPAPPPLLQRKK